MRKRRTLAAGLAAAIILGTLGPALAHGPSASFGNPYCGWHHGGHMGPGMMGQGMGPGFGMGPGYGTGQGMGPGMMGQGMGPGMMGQGMGPGYGTGQGMGSGMMQPLPQDLSAEDVKHMIEHRLAWHGNPNVKVGNVVATDEDTVEAEIVTQDGSLVQKLEVDRHTGWMRPAQ